MTDPINLFIFGSVLIARLLIPLLIPRFPLPAIIAALILDAVDQTIFQSFTTIPLDRAGGINYQGYDKAFDVYYLTIAYISTLRNWKDLVAVKLNRFLFYFRMIGVVIFELTQLRFLLIIFPNTFEYFFIFYEAVRLRWNERRLSRTQLIAIIAAIWIIIKLPQEYIIHIAQIDTTDWLRTAVFGVPVEASYTEMLTASPLITLTLAVIILGLLSILVWLFRKLPAPDHTLTIEGLAYSLPENLPKLSRRDRNYVLLEKFFLLTALTIIFAQLLPNIDATPRQFALHTIFFIIVNTGLSAWLAQLRDKPVSTTREFIGLALANIGLVFIMLLLFPAQRGTFNLVDYTLLSLLLTLITTLFDRYQKVHRVMLVEGDSI